MTDACDVWPTAELREVATPRGLIGGPFGSNLGRRDYRPDGIPVIRGQNLATPPHISFEDCVYVSPEKAAADLAGNTVTGGDLVFTQRGTLGQVAVMPHKPAQAVLSQSQMRLRVDGERADPWFVYYCVSAEAFTKQLNDNAIVSGVPHINLGILGSLRIPLPPLEEQRRIAGVLGALDDLIGADRHLISHLVMQADQVAVESISGGVLETFGDVCDVFGGGTPKTSEPAFWNGNNCWATPSDVTALPSPYLFSTSRRITDRGLAACASELHPSGSVLMTSRATIGAFALAEVPTATNQGFIVVEPSRQEDRYFLLHEMRRRVPEFLENANGSTFVEISRGRFKSLPIAWPSEAARDRLAQCVKPLHDAAAALEREIELLMRQRDELLPLLLSGRVRVDDVAT